MSLGQSMPPWLRAARRLADARHRCTRCTLHSTPGHARPWHSPAYLRAAPAVDGDSKGCMHCQVLAAQVPDLPSPAGAAAIQSCFAPFAWPRLALPAAVLQCALRRRGKWPPPCRGAFDATDICRVGRRGLQTRLGLGTARGPTLAGWHPKLVASACSSAQTVPSSPWAVPKQPHSVLRVPDPATDELKNPLEIQQSPSPSPSASSGAAACTSCSAACCTPATHLAATLRLGLSGCHLNARASLFIMSCLGCPRVPIWFAAIIC